MKVFILMSVVVGAFALQDCPANQHYESCGTACPLTCDNYNDPPKFCILMCNPGCHCDEDYVKTEDEECVLPENCPNRVNEVCGENQQYTGCGTACPLTCKNYRNPPKFCTDKCIIGCECQKAEEKNCLDKPDRGMCLGYFPMFHYDVQSGTCKKFVYGGCQGNGNRYVSEEECLAHCGALASSSDAVCEQEMVVGPCRAAFPRYYFNKQTGQCERFIYGGCMGNDNNFSSKDACESTCVV